MKLIRPSFEILEQKPRALVIPDDMEIGPRMVREELLSSMYRQIEIAGRTAYKSEHLITENSAKEFTDRMIKLNHGAPLEHGTVYLKLVGDEKMSEKYQKNPYSRVVFEYPKDDDLPNIYCIPTHYITTNYRVLIEHNWLDDLKYLCEPTEYHEKRVCVKFICDRGILTEFTRHRTFSFAAESTRYCNYSKNKFNNELTFIIPCWITDSDIKHYKRNIESSDFFSPNKDSTEGSFSFLFSLEEIESIYLSLVKEEGWKPQQARAVLPNALKTELVMTGFVSDWKHFFKLRCSDSAHPQARELAKPLKEEFIKRGYLKK